MNFDFVWLKNFDNCFLCHEKKNNRSYAWYSYNEHISLLASPLVVVAVIVCASGEKKTCEHRFEKKNEKSEQINKSVKFDDKFKIV